jgi:Fe-S cluster assembly protein SufD
MNTTLKKDNKEHFFELAISSSIPEDAWLREIRTEALDCFKKLEFPTTRNEDWKYTKITPLLQKPFKKGNYIYVQTSNYIIPELDAYFIPVVNGIINLTEISLPKGVELIDIQSAKEKYSNYIEQYFTKLADNKNIFTALNTIASNPYLFIIHKKENIEKSIHFAFISKGDEVLVQPRLFIIAEKDSKINIVTSFHSESKNNFVNGVIELVAEENSKIDWTKIQLENNDVVHVSNEDIYMNNNSIFTLHTYTFSGAMVRNNVNVAIDGTNCEANLYGLYLLDGKQHVDNHTKIAHMKAHSNSNELYKGIMDDDSTAVFNGKVHVYQDAQKTNAFQSNKNILLSDNATINTKPELEIYADDVKCSHGSSTGQFDEDALFYLRARGIGEQSAKSLLVEAFANEVTELLSSNVLKNYVSTLIHKKLSKEL